MSDRARRSTEGGMGVRSAAITPPVLPVAPPVLPVAPPVLPVALAAAAPAAPAAARPSWEDPTQVSPQPGGAAVEQATPTHIDPSAPALSSAPVVAPPGTPGPTSGPIPGSTLGPPPGPTAGEQATPTELMARPERSEPIRVISMKAADARPRSEPRVPLHVQLRSIAEVAGIHDPPSGLGHLAPPRDPRQARARRRRDNVVWACVAIVLASGISLAIWLLAGR